MSSARMRPRPAAGTAVVAVGDETVVCAASSGHTVRLNPVASTLWACLDGTATLDEIAADVAAVTGRDLPAVASDLHQLVRRWERLGLVGETPAQPMTPPHQEHPVQLRRVTVPPDE